MNDLFDLLKVAIEQIKNDIFKFAIITTLFVVLFPEYKFWVFVLFVVAMIFDLLHYIGLERDRKDFFKSFEYLLIESSWVKENIEHVDTYFSKSDNSYAIVIGGMGRSFYESWIESFPNKNAWINPVFLQVNGLRIKELDFIFCDEVRIFIPIPRVEIVNRKQCFYYKRDSLAWRLCRVIGKYHIHGNIEGVSEFAGIEIRDD